MSAYLGFGTGRRKTAIARVYLQQGSGKVSINGKDADGYFVNPSELSKVYQPLDVTVGRNQYDITINVRGGGPSGQAGACRMGLARALITHDETNRSALKANGFLTRDPRMVERKKYGQRGARRKFQFSKR
ncbi:MAG: 30S ribosomal protein S9 [Spirochaetales bacterium]|nr:30S ribosomal protein S9 [Spirochaetales bacterium]MCF7938196.1 30S ribosomal protein S9 [Spirochaetales bacterium]